MEKRCGNCEFEYLKVYEYPCNDCCNSNRFIPKNESMRKTLDPDTKKVINSIYGAAVFKKSETKYHLEGLIKNVIFNDPATIVFWNDGTKTVVKCQEGDTYDPEKGLAMAICKKVMGNHRDYYNVFKKWFKKLPKEECGTLLFNIDVTNGIGNSFAEGIRRAMARMGVDTYKTHRDGLLVTAGSRAAFMEDKNVIKLPDGVEGEAELAKYIAEIVDAYIEGERLKGDPDAPFDIYVEVKLRQKYGEKNND